jgi:hypothetical protein
MQRFTEAGQDLELLGLVDLTPQLVQMEVVSEGTKLSNEL